MAVSSNPASCVLVAAPHLWPWVQILQAVSLYITCIFFWEALIFTSSWSTDRGNNARCGGFHEVANTYNVAALCSDVKHVIHYYILSREYEESGSVDKRAHVR